MTNKFNVNIGESVDRAVATEGVGEQAVVKKKLVKIVD